MLVMCEHRFLDYQLSVATDDKRPGLCGFALQLLKDHFTESKGHLKQNEFKLTETMQSSFLLPWFTDPNFPGKVIMKVGGGSRKL